MTRFALALVVMTLGFGCWNDIDLSPEPHLEDAWTPRGLEDQYMVGSVFPISVASPNGASTYEVESLDPTVFALTESETGELIARAVAEGTTNLVLYENGEELASFRVRVDSPTSIQLTVDREDIFGLEREAGEAVVDGAMSLYAGGTADLHVRYFNSRGRLFGGDVVDATGTLPMAVADWSPQANIFRVSAAEAGDYTLEFTVGELTTSLEVRVVGFITELELFDVLDGDRAEAPYHLTSSDGTLSGYQVIEPIARDDRGNIVRGTLPINWTAELDGTVVELGSGTLLGVASPEAEELAIPVTASLDGQTARGSVISADMFVAE